MIRVILLILYLGQFQSHPGDHETRNALRRPVWQFIAAEPPGNSPALATCLHIARPVAMAPVAPPSADSRSWTQAYADQRDLLGCVFSSSSSWMKPSCPSHGRQDSHSTRLNEQGSRHW